MPTFAGVDHLALTVTDLDVSVRFYTELFGFVPVLDVGYGRICMHPSTGFTLGLVTHDGDVGGRFTERTTGLDHLGFRAASRAELEEWERRFDEYGVTYTPIRDMEMGYHLNFRDPDDIALELSAPNELMLAAQARMAEGDITAEAVAAFVSENLDPAIAVRGPDAGSPEAGSPPH